MIPLVAFAMLDLPHITIVGTGLLGASLGLALKARGYVGIIHGVARSTETLNRAQAVGAIDRGETELARAVGDGPGLVVVAVPLGHFAGVFEAIAPLQIPGLIITDVGSTKAGVCNLAEQRLADAGAFVPAHPMAGSEQSGPDHADADLFVGKPCVLTPTDHTDAEGLAKVEAMWRLLGMNVLRMGPADHDDAVATVSHLPHTLAALLMNVAEERGGLEVASTGLRSTSRLASGHPGMRTDILTSNRHALLGSLDALQCHLEALKAALRDGRDDVVLDTLTNAKTVRDRWLDGQAGGASSAASASARSPKGATA